MFSQKLGRLIEVSGGQLDESGMFVEKPGCVLLNMTTDTPKGKEIYDIFNIDLDRPFYEQRAEFKSRLTYLAFRQQKKSSQDYNEKMAKEYQHLSVHSSTNIEFLIAGISIETCLEFVAHGEAKVARLTSSKTKAMNETLYRVQGNTKELEAQKSFINDFVAMRKKFEESYHPRDLSVNGTEFSNMLNLSTKAGALTYSMNIKDFHKLFIGRLSHHGVEHEVQEVCKMMCDQLHEQFPMVIRSSEEYYQMNNGVKYSG